MLLNVIDTGNVVPWPDGKAVSQDVFQLLVVYNKVVFYPHFYLLFMLMM